MKKILAILLATVSIFLFASCGDSNGAVQTVGFSKSDLNLTIDGKKYECDVNVDDITKAFGEDYIYSEALSCAYDGMDKIFGYENLDVYTRPNGNKDFVIEYYVFRGDVKSSKGVTLGGTRDNVIALYGEPKTDTGLLLIYEIAPKTADSEGATLYFELDSTDKISAIGLTAEVLIGEE